ncbi:U32 family peptidase [Anaerofilum sp. BX8]|uniref:U32 family peptidase n=1 Tax=Anaerofilum hominis TaxID=2763016 RepID=A0A923L0E0_9FIRM|nr:U32 family peptidase [Anaerofilum hominis]MBC5580192.1 U32 family peptidase [Anaerofilum hominis]
MRHRPELLAPAGDMERLRFALLYGADAVYLAGDRFGMRGAPKNFSMEELDTAAKLCHAAGKRMYITVNTMPTNEEIDALPGYLAALREIGPDALIVADLGVLSLAKKYAPELELHVSTQAGIVNWAAAAAAYELGAKRVVLARELTLEEITGIREKAPAGLEIEAFVHGAMCMSVSGRCLLSNYMTGRDGNRGQCAQPCRWKYALVEEKRPGEYFEIGENEEGSYILSAEDLCAAPFLGRVAAAGVDSFKLEGRAKSFYYVASVTAAYRRAIDAIGEDPADYLCPPETLAELEKSSHRRYSPGFYLGREFAVQNVTDDRYQRGWQIVAVVERYGAAAAVCTQRGKFELGETIEALLPDGSVLPFAPAWLRDADGQEISSTPHAMMEFTLPVPRPLPAGSILRRKK